MKSTLMSIDCGAYKKVMRKFPGAVNIITTGVDDGRAGLTATAVISLTAEPAQIAVAVNRTASAYKPLSKNRFCCLNTLRPIHADLAQRFAGGSKGIEKFSTAKWDTLITGAPALCDALINLDCRLVRKINFSSHSLFICQVEASRYFEDGEPLLFIDGKWARIAS